MRGILGILLIGFGLLGAYLILSGRFPPSSTAGGTTAAQPMGSGGESIQSSFSQLGYSLARNRTDLAASRGFRR
jgi:hypothetical protein